MKNKRLKEKFNCGVNFVKPLYKKVKFRNKIENEVLDINVGTKYQGGNDFSVTETVNVSDKDCVLKTVLFKQNNNNCRLLLPGVCQSGNVLKGNDTKILRNSVKRAKSFNMSLLGIVGSTSRHNEYIEVGKRDKVTQISNGIIIHKVPDSWLRVYPAPKTPGEPTWSVVFRCLVCQIGLMVALVLWTLLWAFIIFSVEEPYEREVSVDFQKKQNQLVIDLATELRQITPLSPKWRDAIERRIENERQLTVRAVSQGARHDQGHFWDLPGTFLFTIYVMTALGFGAPVPQTFPGRTSALVYAVLAVPTHIYLMVNASTCLVTNVEAVLRKLNNRYSNEKSSFPSGKTALKCQTALTAFIMLPLFNNLIFLLLFLVCFSLYKLESRKESPDCSGNSDLKSESKLRRNQHKLLRCFNALWLGSGVPLVFVLYYTLGAVGFGVLRSREPMDTLMFPIEFTTTGGLERVAGYVRVLYGLYVEGAMSLLACALATLRRHSCGTVRSMTDKFRLFNSEQCGSCTDVEATPHSRDNSGH